MVDNHEQLLPAREEGDETSLAYMLKLAWPMIVTTISFTIMQLIDRFMVSRLGTAELAAVPAAASVGFIPGGFLLGTFSSVGTYVSQSLGRGERANCSSYLWQAVYIGAIYSCVILIIGWPLAERLFVGLGHEPAVVEAEVVYFRIMLIADVAVVFVWASNQFFMGIHRPIISMYSALAAQVTNVAANYVLIFGKFGFPAMGVAGAGWGTLIGVSVGGALRMLLFLTGSTAATYGSRHTLQPNVRKMVRLLKVGMPAGLELALNVALWQTLLYWLVGGFGKEAQAATSAVLSSTHVSIMPLVGLRYALTAAVGRAIGAARGEQAFKQTRVCVLLGAAYTAFVGILFMIFREPLMGLWSSDDNVIRTGGVILLFAAAYQVFYGIRTMYSGALRGAGDTIWLAVASAVGSVAILGAGGWAISRLLPGWGAMGPWTAATLGMAIVGLANYVRFAGGQWKQIDLFERKVSRIPVADETAAEEY